MLDALWMREQTTPSPTHNQICIRRKHSETTCDNRISGKPSLRGFAACFWCHLEQPATRLRADSVSARTPSVPLPARKVREPRQAGLLLLATNTLKPTPACLRSSSVAAFREITWHSMTSCRHRQHLMRRRPATPPCGRGSQSNHARRRSADAECPAARLARWVVAPTALAGHRPSA